MSYEDCWNSTWKVHTTKICMHFKFFHTEISLPFKNVFIRKAERKRGRGKEWKRGREVKRQRDKCVNHTRCWFTPQCPEKPDKVVPGRRREPRTQPESPTYSRDLSTEVMSRRPSPTPREWIVRAGGSKARTEAWALCRVPSIPRDCINYCINLLP